MAGLLVKFQGQCLSSELGKDKKNAYSKFMSKPEPGQRPVEFQVSCKDQVDQESIWKLADWELVGFEPVAGITKEGKAYAFFRCDRINGKIIKV
jgi:hypothetical protein